MSLVQLSAKPTRAELRDAIRALKPLAACGHDQAVAELRALESLARDLYPRRVTPEAKAARQSMRPKRRRRAIEAQDVLCTCRCCRGAGRVQWFRPIIGEPFASFRRIPFPILGLRLPLHRRSAHGRIAKIARLCRRRLTVKLCDVDQAGNPVVRSWAITGRLDAMNFQLLDMARLEPPVCPECHGSGKVVGGTVHYKIVLGECKYFDRFNPVPSPPLRPMIQHTYRHDRGFACGKMFGPETKLHRKIRRTFISRIAGQRERRCTAIDLSAALEARAIARASADRMPKPRHPKKQGSRRDKTNLKARQERRAKMDRRVRRYNAEAAHRRRVEAGVYRCRVPAHKGAEAILAALGINVSAVAQMLECRPPMIKLDDPTIAEARRRGDLPPVEPDQEQIKSMAQWRRQSDGERYERRLKLQQIAAGAAVAD